jgi:hypothetical protein
LPEGIVLTLVPRFTALHRRRRSHAGETRLSRTRTCCLMSMLSAMDRISLLWSEPHRCGPPDAPLDPSMSSLSVTPRIADDSSLWVSGRSGAGPACRVMPSDGWQFAWSRPQGIPARCPLSGNAPGSLLLRPATAMRVNPPARCRCRGPVLARTCYERLLGRGCQKTVQSAARHGGLHVWSWSDGEDESVLGSFLAKTKRVSM